MAVDEFFSSLESQKIDMKAIHQEREAFKKLTNVKKDHDQRLQALEKTQELDKQKAELITRNQELVDNAILAIQSALASQVSCDLSQNIIMRHEFYQLYCGASFCQEHQLHFSHTKIDGLLKCVFVIY